MKLSQLTGMPQEAVIADKHATRSCQCWLAYH